MAVKNGEKFIHEQIRSIIPQLGVDDELIISDDDSQDQTRKIITSFEDPRIKLIECSKKGLVSNFENCLHNSRGEYLFLSDQDDVWAANKISTMRNHLNTFDLIVSDCFIVDEQLCLRQESFFKMNHSGKGLVRNLIRNSYMGCCMAFHRKLLNKALPFPEETPMHDLWLGLIGELYYNVAFIPDKLVYHRRHNKNASSTSNKSSHSFFHKIGFRYQLAKNLIRSSYA
jgi:glycosyltransferase involved in cell wall biosynthesis